MDKVIYNKDCYFIPVVSAFTFNSCVILLPNKIPREIWANGNGAIIYNYLREIGRYLTVKNIGILRKKLLEFAHSKKFNNPRNIYFSPFFYLENEKQCLKKKQKYISFQRYNLPNKITSFFISEDKKIIGVSFGKTTGKLQDIDFLKNNNTDHKKIILYTKFLSPKITEYFDRIFGIVSENGGMLSHLSIIAREQNIPVVIGFKIEVGNIKLGDYITIDGNKGKIEKQK